MLTFKLKDKLAKFFTVGANDFYLCFFESETAGLFPQATLPGYLKKILNFVNCGQLSIIQINP
jgi:hypothetical protein